MASSGNWLNIQFEGPYFGDFRDPFLIFKGKNVLLVPGKQTHYIYKKFDNAIKAWKTKGDILEHYISKYKAPHMEVDRDCIKKYKIKIIDALRLNEKAHIIS